MSRFFITATIKGGSFAYYKTANFLAVLCLRAYIFFCFQAFSCVCYRQIDSLQRHASARSLSFSTFLARKSDFINSIRRAEVIHLPNRFSTSGLIAATNSHLTPTKNTLEARHHDITLTQTMSVKPHDNYTA